MAQLVKHLLCIHDGLNAIPRTRPEPGAPVSVCNPSAGETERRTMGAHWPAGLAELMSSRLSKRLSLNINKTPDFNLWTS